MERETQTASDFYKKLPTSTLERLASLGANDGFQDDPVGDELRRRQLEVEAGPAVVARPTAVRGGSLGERLSAAGATKTRS